ncbi:MAG: response regulator transcription factor [Pantoea dispersa]|nr:response regulator transcription factor [Pantoea dispersa]MBZ6392511.1 response regulator transcription factor [Pantoea dispersa]
MEKIFIFDNNPLVITGLVYYLKKQGFTLSGSTSNPDEMFRCLIIDQPDIIIVDPLLLSEENLKRLSEVKKIFRALKIIIFAGSDSVLHMLRSYRLNWMAYVSKEQPLEKLIQVLVKQPQKNYVVIATTQKYCANMSGTFNVIRNFTGREMQVLREIGAGKTNKVIADEMHLSNKTISTYKRSIMAKLNTRDVRDVIDFARQHGF